MDIKVNNFEELMKVISSSKKTSEFNELVVEGSGDVRNNIISNLSNHMDWVVDTYLTSSKNIWYLFRTLDGNKTISINDNEDDFYNDIVVTIN